MKYLVVLSLAVVLITSLNLGSTHQVAPQSHMGFFEKIGALSDVGDIAKALEVKMGTWQKVPACQSLGVKQATKVTVFNAGKVAIKIIGTFLGAGKVASAGLAEDGNLDVFEKDTWTFRENKGVASTGAVFVNVGVLTYIIYYKPNYCGIRIINRVDDSPEITFLNDQYNIIKGSPPNYLFPGIIVDNSGVNFDSFEKVL